MKNENIGKNIKYYLNRRNISQSELAEYCGVTRGSVSQWCSGNTEPKTSMIGKVAECLNVEVSDLTTERAGTNAPAQNSLNYHFLVENQYLTEGQDLTSADVDFLNSVDRLLTLWFK